MKIRVSALCTLVLMVAAPVLAQQVSVNYVKTQNFSGYHTYAWEEENANQIRNSILAQVAKTDIENAMQSKGLTKVGKDDNPDLILLASGGSRQQTSYSAWVAGPRFGGMGTITPQQSTEGTLIVNLYDAKAKQLVWRGIATGTLSNSGDKSEPGAQSRRKDVQTISEDVVAPLAPGGRFVVFLRAVDLAAHRVRKAVPFGRCALCPDCFSRSWSENF
jgi:hypothetical protein